MCLLKAAMVVSSLIFFGMMAHTLGPIYLKECFPKVMVLNLGSYIVVVPKIVLGVRISEKTSDITGTQVVSNFVHKNGYILYSSVFQGA